MRIEQGDGQRQQHRLPRTALRAIAVHNQRSATTPGTAPCPRAINQEEQCTNEGQRDRSRPALADKRTEAEDTNADKQAVAEKTSEDDGQDVPAAQALFEDEGILRADGDDEPAGDEKALKDGVHDG